VKTSVTVNGETAITSGVQAGETVVTDGQLRLAPGTAVTFKSE
jgi:multidrug efflux pump subunit AcrA (membrane-fusion protein)